MALVKERTKDVLIEEANVNFESLYLSPLVLQGLKENHFVKPSPIQLKAIPLGKCGLDLIVKSKSGTGKTAVFAIIALEMIDTTKNHLQVLILAPTREIAVQSCDVITTIGKYIEGMKVQHFIGGLPVKEDTEKAKGCHIAVASPGRMLHLINSGVINAQNIKLFVLDEADSLMDTSFQSDINKIFHILPQSKQMLAVSATFPNELDVFLSQYMHIPTHVSAQIDTPLLLGLKHFVTITAFNSNTIFLTKFKNTELIRFLSHISFTQCLVFCNYQTRAEEVTNFLNASGWKADFISGAQTQKQRLEVLKKLKEFQCRILLSTDLTARGIDAVNVDLVINYDVPNDESTYLHRMGRAGRYGTKGICISMAAKGAEIAKFCNIIGAIGGCEMSVPVLPKENLPENIWEADVGHFDFVNGTLSMGKTQNDVLRSVKEILRDSCESNDSNEEKTDKRSNKLKSNANLKVKDNFEVKIDKKGDNLEVRNDEIDKFKVRNENSDCSNEENDDTTALLTLLAAGKSKTSNLPENNDGTDVRHDRNSIYNKNLSLLTVSSLLDDDNFDIDSNQTKTIENFIHSLKETQESQNVDDLNDKMSLSSRDKIQNESLNATNESVNDVETNVDLEDVFIHAFDYAICKSRPNWADLYGYQEEIEASKGKSFNLLQDLLEYVANDENPDIEYDEDDYDEYYGEEFDDSVNRSEQNEPDIFKWIPVTAENSGNHSKIVPFTKDDDNSVNIRVENENVCNNIAKVDDNWMSSNVNIQDNQINQQQIQRFETLYENAVEHLEVNFNSLESKEEFEDFWMSWQRQMSSVRDYVQQNLYLNEMNAFKAAGRGGRRF